MSFGGGGRKRGRERDENVIYSFDYFCLFSSMKFNCNFDWSTGLCNVSHICHVINLLFN